MSKLELPMDIGEKVLAMLQPKTRPECVLVFTESKKQIHFKTGTLDDADRDYIMQGLLDNSVGGEDPQYMAFRYCYPSMQVRHALLLGFYFKDEASRERARVGFSFELYRDAVHAIA